MGLIKTTEVVMHTLQQTTLNPWIQEKLDEITSHSAWHGELTGVDSELLLRMNCSFTYLLRQGEKADHFYLSFIRGGEFCHLPFTIDYSSHQWYYLNTHPHFVDDLEVFIPEIMHKEAGECFPLLKTAKTR
jgi:hypothetical protein